MAYLNFSVIFDFFFGQFTIYDAYINFHEGVDNFEIEHKTC